MDTKALFVAARYKYLLILPFALIIPVAGVLSLLSRTTTYESVSRVWVSQLRFAPSDASGCSPYITLAQCQSGLLNEHLSTDAFSKAVAIRAGLATSDEQAAYMIGTVRGGTSVYPGGDQLIVISHRSANAADAPAIVTAIVAEFGDEFRRNTQRDAERAESIYQSRLDTDTKALDDAQAKLGTYVPKGPSASLDPAFMQLQSELQAAQKRYDDTRNALAEARQSASALLGSRDETFKVTDEANVPNAPVPQNKKSLLIYPIAGFLLAISLAASLYAFLLKTDRSVRVVEDLQQIPGVVVLGAVPDIAYARKRHWPKNFFRLAVTGFGSPTK